jgi:predicted  nucleic acid-binding Zn-ribbon protein
MAAKKEITVETKLRTLYDLQLIDSRIDQIRSVRGELPLEIEDLNDHVIGLNKRLSNIQSEIKELEEEISVKKNKIDESKVLMNKYKEQQENVKNSREFNFLTKEIEYQDLEIQLSEKRIKDFKIKIAQKKEIVDASKQKIKLQNEILDRKTAELNTIMDETSKEENQLTTKSEEFSKLIEEQLLKAYKRIRNGVENGQAVVSVDRGASSGSFFTIPPQKQVEIASRKKIIIDEYSGRILVDGALAEEETKKMNEIIGNDLF